MSIYPPDTLRRLVPDAVQFQVMLGSLLGNGRLVGRPGDRRLRIAHRVDRAEYVWWKYDRLGSFAHSAPHVRDSLVGFDSIAHPIFDDLVALLASGRTGAWREGAKSLLRPLGLAVWLADVGRIELRPREFLPRQRETFFAEMLALAG